MISIIIPVYNTLKYLPRCIDSVIRQSYTQWELILVDDESSDGSGKICDDYAAKYDNIKAVHKKNGGPAAARQTGLGEASGEWIMFADSDDWLDKDILNVLVSHQKETKALMVCCNFVNVDDNGKKTHIKTLKSEYVDCFNDYECMFHIHATRYLTGSPCTKLIKKELFDGIDFCSNVTIGEDYAMIVQLAQRAKRVRILSEELYYRYVRRGSISHMGYSKRHEGAFDNYMKIRLSLIESYPGLRKEITGFHTEYEMAVITAMCRNKNYDKDVIKKLKSDLKKNMKLTWSNGQIPFYMKCCAFMIAYMTGIFTFLFRILYLMTGR